MSALTKILTGAAGLAAVVGFASPAAAQYYPGYGYGGGNQGNVLGTIISGVLGGGGQYGGYNSYGSSTRIAVQQCAAAVQQRLGGGYGGYGAGYGGHHQGYGGYNQGYSGGRVLGITHADRHGGGTIKVKGLATSGGNSGYGGYNQGYGAQADLKFTCRTDYRGGIIDLDIDRRNNGYSNGYYRGY